MFYNRNMGNVEYDNTLRLPPNAYQVATDFWAGGGYGNGARSDLRHDQRGDARQPHRQHRHQLADAGFVHLAEDTQLQHVVRAAHPVEPGRRGQLRRHAGNATSSAAATATSCRMASMSSGTFNGVDLSVPVNRVAVASVERQPRVVPALQRAERHHALQLPRRVELRLAAGDPEPADRAATSSTSSPTPTARRAARLATNTRPSTRTMPTRTYGVLGAGSHARPERLVERVPARRRARQDGQRDRPRAAERLAALRASRRSRAAFPYRLELQRRGCERIRLPPPTSARPTSSVRRSAAATASRRSTRAIRRSAARMSARRFSTSTASASRRSARTATSCRRTTCVSRRGRTTT